ncbi:MAG: hypothetical protein M3445_04130, partial [Actinomycetota bacterium]|nr:hypothetical protein [Actinomycetota bacterium]
MSDRTPLVHRFGGPRPLIRAIAGVRSRRGVVSTAQVVVPDAEVARRELLERGVDAPEVETLPW